MPGSVTKAGITSFPSASVSALAICVRSASSGSRASVTAARTRLSFTSTSSAYSRAISSSRPCRPRATTACRKRTNSPGVSLSAEASSRDLAAWGPAARSARSALRATSPLPRRPPRSARRTPPSGRSAPPARRALRHSCGRSSRRSSMLAPHRAEVLHDQRAVGVGLQPPADQLGGGGERELDRLAPEVGHGALALRLDLAAGAGQQLLLLVPGLLQRGGPLLLAHRLPLGHHLVDRGLGLGEEALVLFQRLLRLGVHPCRLEQLPLDGLLALLGGPEDRGPRELLQDDEERDEDRPGPEEEAEIDLEGRQGRPGFRGGEKREQCRHRQSVRSA